MPSNCSYIIVTTYKAIRVKYESNCGHFSEFPPSPQPTEAPFCQPALAKPLSEREVHAEFDLFSFFEEVDASESQWEKEKAQQRALEAGTPVLLRTDIQSKQSCWIKRGEYLFITLLISLTVNLLLS